MGDPETEALNRIVCVPAQVSGDVYRFGGAREKLDIPRRQALLSMKMGCGLAGT